MPPKLNPTRSNIAKADGDSNLVKDYDNRDPENAADKKKFTYYYTK